jgi:hypothetical protein
VGGVVAVRIVVVGRIESSNRSSSSRRVYLYRILRILRITGTLAAASYSICTHYILTYAHIHTTYIHTYRVNGVYILLIFTYTHYFINTYKHLLRTRIVLPVPLQRPLTLYASTTCT